MALIHSRTSRCIWTIHLVINWSTVFRFVSCFTVSEGELSRRSINSAPFVFIGEYTYSAVILRALLHKRTSVLMGGDAIFAILRKIDHDSMMSSVEWRKSRGSRPAFAFSPNVKMWCDVAGKKLKVEEPFCANGVARARPSLTEGHKSEAGS